MIVLLADKIFFSDLLSISNFGHSTIVPDIEFKCRSLLQNSIGTRKH